MNIDKNGHWEFVTYDADGRINLTSSLSDLQYTWEMRMQENTFDMGWNFEMSHRVYGIGRHISATKLNANLFPANLRVTLAGSNPNNKIWKSIYDEKYDGLQGIEVFTEITTYCRIFRIRPKVWQCRASNTNNEFICNQT